ncbi:hypothetical protein J7T55_009875 [Diaporthe amygdali]|uniref:uncharacterized protein n=1 Tax=Phomopsis amygdali TaxID=1214568 RepID=UPI0022FDFAAB|nr:uncharacterized protein J7T55_009875 [Diaporthe amygdali]KAJ0116725.1 hypothetical protein J7T55_009875 [Diaporthe amygdali]
MATTSFDLVSNETQQKMELFLDVAWSRLRASGFTHKACKQRFIESRDNFRERTVRMAVQAWKTDLAACTAEFFVQRFVETMFYGACNYKLARFGSFTTATDKVPLAPEFLEAIGMTEAEVLQLSMLKSPVEEGKSNMHVVSDHIKASTSRPVVPNPMAAIHVSRALEQWMKGVQLSDNDTSTLGTRKNDEPEATARKHGRRDDGQKMPLSSSITNSKPVQWTGVPLTAAEQHLMNTDLMNVIWNTKISERLKPDHGPGIFEVRILKDAAWSLLGKDINRVFALIALRGPIRLHTFQSGRFLHIGLWIKRGQTEGEMGKVIHYSMVEMFRLLRQWSLQAQDSEKAQCLADFLEVWYR